MVLEVSGPSCPMNSLFCLGALSIELSLSQPGSFLTLIMSPVLWVGERVKGCIGLGCWLGLNQEGITFKRSKLAENDAS